MEKNWSTDSSQKRFQGQDAAEDCEGTSKRPWMRNQPLCRFLSDENGVYYTVLARTRCHAGRSQRSFNCCSLRNHSSAIVVHVGWILYHAKNLYFGDFSRGVRNVYMFCSEQTNFLFASMSSTNLLLGFAQTRFNGKRAFFEPSFRSIPSFSAARSFSFMLISMPDRQVYIISDDIDETTKARHISLS